MSAFIELRDHTQPAVQAVVDRLQAGLPAALGAAAATDTLGRAIEMPAQILDYVPTPRELQVFPTFAVQEGEVAADDDTGAWFTARFEFSVVIFAASDNQQLLARRLRVYRDCALDVLLPRDRKFGPFWGLAYLGSRPGPTLGRGENPRDWISYSGFTIEGRYEVGQEP